MDANEEFLKALSMIETIVPETIEYRIHYDNTGNITMCTMQQHPTDTQYIVVDQDTYDHYYLYTVVDHKLKKIDRNPGYRVQLKKSDAGYTTVKNHAGIILEDEQYLNVEYYDNN